MKKKESSEGISIGPKSSEASSSWGFFAYS